MSRQTITNKTSHLYWIIYKAWFSTVFFSNQSFSNLISHSSLIEYTVTFLIWCLQCWFIWMPFTRTISFNKWHFEESVAGAWHVLVNSNLAVAGVLKYQGLQISSARVLKVINWRWMLWNYKRFRLKRCKIWKNILIVQYFAVPLRKIKSCLNKIYLCELFLTLSRCQVHLVPERKKKNGKKDQWPLWSRITAEHLVIFRLSKTRQQLLSNFPPLWHLLCTEV